MDASPPPPAAAAAADAEHADGGAAAADPRAGAGRAAAPAFHEPNKSSSRGQRRVDGVATRADAAAVPGPRHRAHGGRAAPRE